MSCLFSGYNTCYVCSTEVTRAMFVSHNRYATCHVRNQTEDGKEDARYDASSCSYKDTPDMTRFGGVQDIPATLGRFVALGNFQVA